MTPSSGGLEGLHGLVSHITKPIATLLDVELRDNLEALERSHKHLNKIRKSTETNALRTDSVIIDHDIKIESNAANIEYLANELGKLKFESSVSKSAATEKLGKLKTNPLNSYHPETNRAPDAFYAQAVRMPNPAYLHYLKNYK